MTVNNFKPFASGLGANVLTQVQYEALPALISTGFTAGVAPSVQLNKVWRQSSIMAAVLAQFISDLSGADAIDDGTTATLLANLKIATQGPGQALSPNGYHKLSGGLILQWGTETAPASGVSTSSVSVFFPIAFTSAVASITGAPNGNANTSAGGFPVFAAPSPTLSGFSAVLDVLGFTTFNQTCTFKWFAIGY
jgi:hypothetical protein